MDKDRNEQNTEDRKPHFFDQHSMSKSQKYKKVKEGRLDEPADGRRRSNV